MEMLTLSYNNDDLLSPCTEELVKIATYHLLGSNMSCDLPKTRI